MRVVVQQAAAAAAVRADEVVPATQIASWEREPAEAQNQQRQPPQQLPVQSAAIDGEATAISSMRQSVDGATAAISSVNEWIPAVEEPTSDGVLSTGDDELRTGDGVGLERRRRWRRRRREQKPLLQQQRAVELIEVGSGASAVEEDRQLAVQSMRARDGAEDSSGSSTSRSSSGDLGDSSDEEGDSNSCDSNSNQPQGYATTE